MTKGNHWPSHGISLSRLLGLLKFLLMEIFHYPMVFSMHWRDLLTFDSRKLIFFQSRMRSFVNNINNKHKLNSFFRAFIYYFFYTTISFSTTFFCGFSYILYLMNTKITDESTHTYTTEQLTWLQTSNISMHTQNEHFGCQFSEM